MQIVPVILCGGSGTRLWPLSRTHLPKQFLRLAGDRSLLQDTVFRLHGLADLGRMVAVANEDNRFLLAEQFAEIGVESDILLEPAARNTAPAIAAAACWVLSRDKSVGEPLLLVLPSDHAIADTVRFRQAVQAGIPHAKAGRPVTFGITPVRAETGYGYIERGKATDSGYLIERFVEKPDLATATTYLASGEYYWNSGMFLMRADTYLDVLRQHAPEIATAAERSVEAAKADLNFVRLDPVAFAGSPSDSIDYAVMEHVGDGVVVPLDAGWNDIGAWDALHQLGPSDAAGNFTQGDILLQETSNSLIWANSRLVAAIGVADVVIVETADAVLVTRMADSQAVKQVVARLKAEGRCESEFHTVVHRPWGSYEGVAEGSRYQVKRLIVKPGRSLSLQMHHHRAEHWVVVRGTAQVTRGDEILTLSENQSTYIPLGATHRLENPGRIDLEIIEVQSGSYLGEDDIVRLNDTYGRHEQ
jgi:mannose-1-phosphate guanylyltransferase/mannose-6-phosphate isomerase